MQTFFRSKKREVIDALKKSGKFPYMSKEDAEKFIKEKTALFKDENEAKGFYTFHVDEKIVVDNIGSKANKKNKSNPTALASAGILYDFMTHNRKKSCCIPTDILQKEKSLKSDKIFYVNNCKTGPTFFDLC